jgi:hypothetical protein
MADKIMTLNCLIAPNNDNSSILSTTSAKKATKIIKKCPKIEAIK